ncbi:MAG: NADH:flavin oxidoreductase/NADH oxidase [Gemmatimonadales bacterium]
MTSLFAPYELRGLTLGNRIAVSPMCQYSSDDGFANDWHLVHLVSRAVGGAGLVFTEATAVVPEGRISPVDLGIWKDEHVAELERIVGMMHARGAATGIQLAHAGRKASVRPPWASPPRIEAADGGWQVEAPSAVAYSDDYPAPRALEEAEIAGLVSAFRAAARRADAAGFDVVELHAAHGYLVHEFLSPVSNRRGDRYGGSFENRIRFLLEIVTATREVWPERKPLFVRISATDWVKGGWSVDDSVELARRLGPLGVDLIDCSSGGNVTGVRYPVGPGYQAAFAERIRREAGIPTGAVGMITEPAQADQIVRSGQADLVLLARELLRDPYWPMRAARALGVPMPWPIQYLRAAPAGSKPRGPFEPSAAPART